MHETPLTSCGHAYMCFDFFIPVFNFMSIQITFKRIVLTTFVTNKLVSVRMHIPVSLQCVWGWKNSITVRAFDRAMVFTVMVVYFLFTVVFGPTFNARINSFLSSFSFDYSISLSSQLSSGRFFSFDVFIVY